MGNILDAGFCGPSYQLESGNVALDRSVNLYLETVQRGVAKNKQAMVQIPGTLTEAVTGTPVNGIFGVNSSIVSRDGIVIGANHIYRVIQGSARIDLGTVAYPMPGDIHAATAVEYTNQGAPHPAQIIIAYQGGIYLVDPVGATITPITVPFSGSLTDMVCTWLDSRLIVNNPTTQNFYYSAVGDPTTIPSTNVATKEASADLLYSVRAFNELLWLFGEFTTEVWSSTGDSFNPFQRIASGGVLEYGAFGPWAHNTLNDSLIAVMRTRNGSPGVYRTDGIGLKKISTYAVDQWLAAQQSKYYMNVAVQQYEGHVFAVLSMPPSLAVGTQFVYDAVENEWHERGVWGGSAYSQTASRFSSTYGESQPTLLVGGGVGSDPNVYTQQQSYGSFDGAPVQIQRDWAHYVNAGDRVQADRLIFDLNTNVCAGDTFNLRYSLDGGQNYGATHAKVAQSGEKRLIYRQLGSGRDRAFSLISSSINRKIFAAAYFELVGLDS